MSISDGVSKFGLGLDTTLFESRSGRLQVLSQSREMQVTVSNHFSGDFEWPIHMSFNSSSSSTCYLLVCLERTNKMLSKMCEIRQNRLTGMQLTYFLILQK